jgi:hypothetical protein
MYSVTLTENSLVHLSFTSLPLQSIDEGSTNLSLKSGGMNAIFTCAQVWGQVKKSRLHIFIIVLAFLLIALLAETVLCDGPGEIGDIVNHHSICTQCLDCDTVSLSSGPMPQPF